MVTGLGWYLTSAVLPVWVTPSTGDFSHPVLSSTAVTESMTVLWVKNMAISLDTLVITKMRGPLMELSASYGLKLKSAVYDYYLQRN